MSPAPPICALRPPRRWPRALLFLLAGFMFSQTHFHSTRESPQATLADLAAGRARARVQRRILAPMLARALSDACGLKVRVCFQLVEFAAAAGLLAAYAAFAARWLGERWGPRLAFALLYPMLWNSCVLARQYFPSETPAALLFVWGVNCLLSGRTWWAWAVFGLACANRESSLALAFAALAARPPGASLRRALLRAASMAAIWAAARAALAAVFPAPADGSVWPSRVADNLDYLAALVRMEPYARRCLWLFGGAWAAIPFVWRRLPRPIKGLTLLALPYGLAAVRWDWVWRGESYPELVPIVFAPALFWLAAGLPAWGTRRRAPRVAAPAASGWARAFPTAARWLRPRAAAERLRGLPWRWMIVCALLAYACARVHDAATVEFMDNTRAALAMGRAPKPFQYRVLVPWMAGALSRGAVVSLRGATSVINAAFVCLLLCAYRSYLAPLTGRRDAAGLCFLIVVPILFNYAALNRLYYPADLPGVAFFIAGAVCLRRRRWALYYVVFFLATINRETSCFLTFLMLFTQWRRGRRVRLLAHAAAQFVIWAAVKVWLAWLFRANPGAVLFENQLRGNLRSLLAVLSLQPHALRFLLVFGLAWAAVPWAWRRLPPFHRRALLTAIPFLLGMSIVGNLLEVRIYGELIPLVTTPAILWLREKAGEGAV